jgi:hypothetical protein
MRVRGVEEKVVRKGLDMILLILEEHGHLTRRQLVEHLITGGLELTDSRDLNYVIIRSEIEGLICSGKAAGNKHTYALLHHRAPKKLSLHKEEMLEKLARKYFSSHGPATVDDYMWWSGLTKTDAKKGIELIKHNFICEIINGKTYWMPNNIQTPIENIARLLPAFDEFVVSYKDREEIIDEIYYRKVLTINGIFSPTIHYNGKAVGSWKRVNKKKEVVAELSFFETTPKKIQERFSKQLKMYERFNANGISAGI